MTWNILIVVAGILLLLVAIWKEYARPNRQRLGWRITATILAIVALVCIGLPLSYRIRNNEPEEKMIHIVTPGFSQDSVTGNSITTDFEIAKKGIDYVPDIPLYLNEHPEYTLAKIKGYGMPIWDLERLPVKAISSNEPALPAGIVNAYWQPYLKANQLLTVSGQYNNTGNKVIKLLLEGLNTALDSVTISPGLQSFSLSVIPKHLSTAVYHLVAIHEKDTINMQPVPVAIQPAIPVNVLILASAPDFENRFLSDWLYEHHYTVAVKSSISKNKTAVQLSNANNVSIGTINSNLLADFDVVITDDAGITSLGTSEQAALRTAVQQGMGLILKTDSNSNKSFAARSFSIVQQPGHTIKGFPLQLSSRPGTHINLLSDQWSFIRSQENEQPLVTVNDKQWVASARLYGSGKLVATTVHNSYSWLLAGNIKDYAAYWSLLIDKAAQRKEHETHWSFQPQFATVNEPQQVRIMGTSQEIPLIKTAGAELYLQQDIYLPAEWTGTWWPTQTGWQYLYHGTDSIPVFVYNKHDWQAVRTVWQMQEQEKFLQHQTLRTLTSATTQHTGIRYFPKIYFFILMVVCCGFLWIESKWIV